MEQQKDNQEKKIVTSGIQGGFHGNIRETQGHNQNNHHRVQLGLQNTPGTQSTAASGYQTGSRDVTTQRPQHIQGFGYVVRRAEKLTTALYLVTDIMPEKEPMKWKVREVVVDLLSDITISSSLSVSEKMTILRNIMKKAEKVVAFLEVAQSAHLMSEMNSSMLKKEYLALKDSVELEWNKVYEKSKSAFSESFFDISHESISEPDEASRHHHAHPPKMDEGRNILEPERYFPLSSLAPRKDEHRGLREQSSGPQPASAQERVRASTDKFPPQVILEKKAAPIDTSSRSSISGPAVSSPKMNIAPMPPSLVRESQEFSRGRNERNDARQDFLGVRYGGERSSTQNTVDRDDRRKIILALIKQKPALTVKDIAKSLSHVSEKTIQRELFSMVLEGVLAKKGERRWSTYSLRNNSPQVIPQGSRANS